MTAATVIESTTAPSTDRRAAQGFWLRYTGYGLLLGASIALLEFAHYYPLVSTPDRLGLAVLGPMLLSWCGQSVLLALTVGVFESREAPRLLGAPQLALAVAIGAIAGALAWQAFVHEVLREQFGFRVLYDYAGQPASLVGSAVYHSWLLLLFGGLAAAAYSSRQRHTRMLAALRAAELDRETTQRKLAEARLAALHARIDPEFLFQTLKKLEGLYEADPSEADRVLEELIVFLRGALADAEAIPAR